MKKRISWSLIGVFLVVNFIVGYPFEATPATASSVTLEVFNPTGAKEVTELHAPRLGDLNGKTICMLSGEAWQAYRTLPLLRELLTRRFPTAKIIPHTEFPLGYKGKGGGIDSDKAADLVVKKGCQGVIIGNAG